MSKIYTKNNFSELEKIIINHLIKDVEESNVLSDQLKYALIKSREFSNVGFFTSFEILATQTKTTKISLELSNIHIIDESSKYGLGFTLFIKEGQIDLLEGYTFGDDKWPEKIIIKHIK